MTVTYYNTLYSAQPVVPCSSAEWTFPVLAQQDLRWLNRPITAEEIKASLFQMASDKALGPDGYTASFFQRFWNIVEQPILQLLHGIFSSGQIPDGLNQSLICLIPKCASPSTLNQFRPISLCNVLIKVVSKLLANRLKPMMIQLTGVCQSSFIPGRSTTDNITAAQEAIHSLSKRKGANGAFILKVDLEKAYDLVDWSFLREVLVFSDFNTHLCNLIMTCITTSTLSLCWNGEQLPVFSPGRGLRQGDPLSPYLFVLCMEVLGQSISKSVSSLAWKPIRLSRQGPSVSHIFFADDLLLFGEASFSQAHLMEHVLAVFCGMSGQRVNRNKSRVWFSPNTPQYLRGTICSAFQIPSASDLGVYLGVPLVHGRLKRGHFQFLIERTKRRLAGWKVKLLSKAARLVLLKATLSSLPIYAMQTTAIPKSVFGFS